MATYEFKARIEMSRWRMGIRRPSGMIQRYAKQLQDRVNSYIPEKAHHIFTESIKKMVKAALVGSEYTTSVKPVQNLSLEEKERLVKEKLSWYKKTAALEGAGTGAGGILLGIADFPLLLSIKMKFLFESATLYGFDIRSYEERIFILEVFQVAFSSPDHRKLVLERIERWEENVHQLEEPDWRKLQQEYRDYIDLVKLLQLVPGIGAVVGAVANYNLLDRLGENAMNAYRLRVLKP